MKQAADPIPETAPTGTARRAVRFLAKLGLVVLAGIGLGIAAYYGFPAVYSGFVQPVQINTQRIAEVETSLESELDASFDRLEALDARLAGVETELAAGVEALGSVQADLQGLQDSLGVDQGDVQRVRALETRLADLASELEAAQTRLTSIEESVEESRPPVEALNERIQLLRAMELVLRARLALADNNPGLAGQDLRRARGVLASATAPQDWAPIVDRLDMALSNLNTAPLVAVQDVEAAWYLMLEASAP
jgi:chromosome segregation ATPase